MSASGVTCELWVDGERVADGRAGDDPDAPTGLAGLNLTWGRDTTVDQPEPSTCSFTLRDRPGGTSFADVVHVGSTVQVLASGIVYPDPTVSTFLDAGFETTGPITTAASNLAAARSTRRADAGLASAQLRPGDFTRRGSVVLAPAPFAAPGTNPDAWDAIPATAAAQRWGFGASVFAPPGAVVRLRPALFTGPYAAAVKILSAPVLTVTGDPTTPAWKSITGTFQPDQPGAWVGLAVEVWPAGYAWDQVPAALTWDSIVAADPAWSWDDAGTVYLDDVAVLAPTAGTTSTVLVFSGRISDLESSYDRTPILRATSVDFTADLDNIDIGDEPWPAEALSTRVDRILAAAMPTIPAQIDPSLATVQVSWRDVDRQSAAGLIAELAASVDGILWSATHQVSGPYLRVEDPAARPSSSVLALDAGVVRIVTAAPAELVVSACDLLRDPMSWTQAVTDIVTRVAVTWLQEGLDGDGATITTEHTYTLIDLDREAAWGVRAMSLSTQLRNQDDAIEVAARILARTGLGWRANGATLDDDEDIIHAGDDASQDPTLQVQRILALLDGTRRNGVMLNLVDLPAWAPGAPAVNVYLEGGRYTFEDGGRWVLELTVSDGAGTGTSATWDDLPSSAAWSWNAFDPGISWADLRGTGVQA